MMQARALLKSQKGRQAEDYYEAINILWRKWEIEDKALSSVIYFNGGPSMKALGDEIRTSLKSQFQWHGEKLEEIAKAMGYETEGGDALIDGGIPERVTRGPLDFGLPESKLSGGDLKWYADRENRLSGDAKFELANFVDGERNVNEIKDALSAEFGPIDRAVVAHYLEDLVKVGVLKWKGQ
jgi:hypothetical protein